MKIEVSFTMVHTFNLPSVRVQGVACTGKTFLCSENIQTYSLVKGDQQQVSVLIELVGWVDQKGEYHSIRREECTSFEGLEVDFKVANKADIADIEVVVLCN